MTTIENAKRLAGGATAAGALFGIFADNGFQTGRDMAGTVLTQGPAGLTGTHDVTTQGYWNYPPTNPSDFAGPIHHNVPNFTSEQLHIAGPIEGATAAIGLGIILYAAGKLLFGRHETPKKRPAAAAAIGIHRRVPTNRAA